MSRIRTPLPIFSPPWHKEYKSMGFSYSPFAQFDRKPPAERVIVPKLANVAYVPRAYSVPPSLKLKPNTPCNSSDLLQS